MERDATTGIEKQIAFATMARTFKSWLATGNYIGAYLVAFSFAEDRLTALWTVRQRFDGKRPARRATFVEKVEALTTAGDVPTDLAVQLKEEAKARNKLVHAAMWNLDAFQLEACERTFKLARALDRWRRAQRNRLGG